MRRIFISFKIEDRQQVEGFRLLARNPNVDFEFYDESVRVPFDSANAEYIRRKIREKIQRCSVTVCLIGTATYQSKWVEWEIRESAKLGKGLLGVWLKDTYGPVPQALRDLKAEIVPWNVQQIDRAIERAAVGRE